MTACAEKLVKAGLVPKLMVSLAVSIFGRGELRLLTKWECTDRLLAWKQSEEARQSVDCREEYRKSAAPIAVLLRYFS